MSGSRSVPLLAAIACGLVPLTAKYHAARAFPIPMGGPCTLVVTGCIAPNPTAGGCYVPGAFSGSSCEVVTLLNVHICSFGTGSCTLRSSADCARINGFIGMNTCQNGACVGGVEAADSPYYRSRPTCAS
ncbi:MAG: hypothetical protein K2X82_04190 [Gemmataceae bacterium]|nr:hypothetical protein [Gemmataceae bacterium]